MADLVYKVEDRSILLPHYRRFAVDPLLPFIPAKISPNAITHAGHLVNLMGAALLLWLRPEGGWLYFVAALTLNFYTWCDNADGAHARRTKQCSPLGEFLDHGLDQFNSVYMAYLTAMALGASPLGWVALVLLIPGAPVVTYWEQSNTGVFRLGMLNQLESVVVLTAALVITGIFGQSFWAQPAAFGLAWRDVMIIWPSVTILFGMLRNVGRVVGQRGARSVLPILVYFGFSAAIFGGIFLGALTTPLAVALASALNVHFGMRMLARRLKKEPPQIEPFMLGGAIALAVLILWKVAGLSLEPKVVPAAVIVACAALGVLIALDARTSVTLLTRVDQTA